MGLGVPLHTDVALREHSPSSRYLHCGVSGFFIKSESACADSSGRFLDFALYGRRRAAGKEKGVFYQVQR